MATKKSVPARKPAKGRGSTARKSTARRVVSRKAVPRAAKPTKKTAAAAAAGERRVRRAIFIDVENASSEEALTEVLESLKIDRSTQPVELTAVGNWRVAGQRLGRHLAGLGAQLVHSAPAPGVKDWSDLWIAVAAGCWLGRAEPGDMLDIVSNDRAFDAVTDAAAARGVIFRRLQHRRGGTTAAHAAAHAADEERPARRSRRGGRRRGRRRPEHAIAPAAAATAAAAPAPSRAAAHEHPRHARPAVEVEPHGASRDQMLLVIDRLTSGDSSRWVNLDILEKALKAEGFARPPGSPRLVTRLRSLKEVEIDSHGRVRLLSGLPVPIPTPSPVPLEEPPAVEAAAPAKRAAPKRRRSRRKTSPAAAEGDGGGTPPVEARPAMTEPPAE